MPVGIIAGEGPVFEPEYGVDTQVGPKAILYIGFRKTAVAVRRQQAVGSGNQQSAAVRLDRATLESETEAVDTRSLYYPGIAQPHGGKVVVVCGKLQPPAVELIIDHGLHPVYIDGQGAVVARPGVVCRQFDIFYIFTYGALGQIFGRRLFGPDYNHAHML